MLRCGRSLRMNERLLLDIRGWRHILLAPRGHDLELCADGCEAESQEVEAMQSECRKRDGEQEAARDSAKAQALGERCRCAAIPKVGLDFAVFACSALELGFAQMLVP